MKATEIVEKLKSVLLSSENTEEVKQELSQEVEILGHVGRLLFYAGSLVSVDQDFILSQRSNRDMFGASIEADTYHVESLLSHFNEADLRDTGTAYPEWIQRRYLALPDDIPQRVHDLAQQAIEHPAQSVHRVLTLQPARGQHLERRLAIAGARNAPRPVMQLDLEPQVAVQLQDAPGGLV